MLNLYFKYNLIVTLYSLKYKFLLFVLNSIFIENRLHFIEFMSDCHDARSDRSQQTITCSAIDLARHLILNSNLLSFFLVFLSFVLYIKPHLCTIAYS